MNEIPRWHYAMLNDGARNSAFERAIEQVVRPGNRVIDIGAGTGLLSRIAARSGAASVDAFEAHPHMADVADELMSASDEDACITLHRNYSTEAEFPPDLRGNVLVTEIFDCAVIGEGILPTLRSARASLLRPGYVSVPRRVTLSGALIASSQIRQLNEVGSACGYDLRLLNRLQTQGHYPVRLRTWPHRIASRPEKIYHLNLAEEPEEVGSWAVTFVADARIVCDGICAWFDMEVADGISISSNPDGTSHWMQTFIAFPQPLPIQPGDQVTVRMAVEDDVRLTVAEVVREARPAGRLARSAALPVA